MEGQDGGSVDNPEILGSVADDVLRLFRLNFFVMAIFSSIIGIIYQNNPEMISAIIDSPYTLFGLIIWFGTSTVSILTYRAARLYSTANARDNPASVLNSYKPELIIRNATTVAFGVLFGAFGLFFGYMDATSNGDFHIGFPILIISLGILALLAIVVAMILINTTMTTAGIIYEQVSNGIFYLKEWLGSYVRAKYDEYSRGSVEDLSEEEEQA